MITPKQLDMLRSFERDGEASDLYDFDGGGPLAWRNREQVINALHRKGLLNEDGITPVGRRILEAAAAIRSAP